MDNFTISASGDPLTAYDVLFFVFGGVARIKFNLRRQDFKCALIVLKLNTGSSDGHIRVQGIKAQCPLKVIFIGVFSSILSL